MGVGFGDGEEGGVLEVWKPEGNLGCAIVGLGSESDWLTPFRDGFAHVMRG